MLGTKLVVCLFPSGTAPQTGTFTPCLAVEKYAFSLPSVFLE